MQHKNLPSDSSALAIGIIAVVLALTGFCCGIFAFATFVLSIVGLVMVTKSLKIYNEDPSQYSATSYSNVITAKILNIIGLVISSLVMLFYLFYILIYGAAISTIFLKAFELNKNYNERIDDSLEPKSLEFTIDSNEIKFKEKDTLIIDSIYVIESDSTQQ